MRNKFLTTITVAVCLAAGVAQPLRAQEDMRRFPRPAPRSGARLRFSPGSPNANGSCTSANGTDVNRIPTGVVIAADVIFFVADTVRELAQDACKQDVVALGEGGNTSLVCTIVDTVWVIAKAVDEGIRFCDDDLTGA